jgi:hypothetical protein
LDGWDIGDRGSGVSLRGEGGVVGGSVETTGGGVEFAGEFHTDEHFATGFVVVGGGVEEGGDGLGSGAVLQEVEDGLAVGGVKRAGAETCQVVVVVFTEEMVGGEQEGVVRVIGSGGEENAAADGFQEGRRWGWWDGRAGRGRGRRRRPGGVV